jgi:transposase-like protein
MGAITAEVVETGEKRDRRGRRVTPSEQRVRTVQAFQSSGMTMAAFARREGINYTTLSGWVMRSQRSASAKPAFKFTEVRLPLAASAAEPGDHLEVRLPDGTLVRGRGVAEVAALVKALRA